MFLFDFKFFHHPIFSLKLIISISGGDKDSTFLNNISSPLILPPLPSPPPSLPPSVPPSAPPAPPGNNYLQELTASGFWSFNDSIDLSKYEQFDHSKFLGK